MLHWIRLLWFVAHTSCYVGYVFSASLHTNFMLHWIRLVYFIAHTSCYVGYVFSSSLHTLHITLTISGWGRLGWGWDYWRPWSSSFTTFSALDMCSLRRCTHCMLHWVRLLWFVAHTHTLHVTLDTSCLLHCTHFMLRWICLLFFVAHTSYQVGYVLSTSLHTLHVTLDTSCLLRCTHFLLRWIRLVYFVAHTSCYIGYVFSASLHTLHVTLDTSCLLRRTHFMLPWICLLCFVAHTSYVVASSQPKRWASWHEGKTTAGAAVSSHIRTWWLWKCDNFVPQFYWDVWKMRVLLQWELKKSMLHTSKICNVFWGSRTCIFKLPLQ